MATNSKYTALMSAQDQTIIRAGVALLVTALTPYRADPIVSRKVFGLFTLSITIGDVLDFLTRTFGPAPAAL